MKAKHKGRCNRHSYDEFCRYCATKASGGDREAKLRVIVHIAFPDSYSLESYASRQGRRDGKPWAVNSLVWKTRCEPIAQVRLLEEWSGDTVPRAALIDRVGPPENSPTRHRRITRGHRDRETGTSCRYHMRHIVAGLLQLSRRNDKASHRHGTARSRTHQAHGETTVSREETFPGLSHDPTRQSPRRARSSSRRS